MTKEEKAITVLTRESENELIERCLSAATTQRDATSATEADAFRLAAMLIKSRHPDTAEALERCAARFFERHRDAHPKPFSQIIAEGTMRDLPRLRQLFERKLDGVRTW